MDLGLAGKVALVTGGSKGIGRATIELFAREGCRVATCARDLPALEAEVAAVRTATGAEMLPLQADVTRPADIQRMVAATADRFGGVDILVNNAGRAYPGRFATLTDEHFQADLEVKLFSMIRCSRAVIPHMKARGGGRIVNVNAIFAKQPDPSFFATSTNRAACLAFTKALAKELAPDNILVNAVNIGFVESAQWENIRRMRAPEAAPGDFFAQMARDFGIPLGRYGRAEEAAAVIIFLASAPAGYVTGTAIEVDGGMAKYL